MAVIVQERMVEIIYFYDHRFLTPVWRCNKCSNAIRVDTSKIDHATHLADFQNQGYVDETSVHINLILRLLTHGQQKQEHTGDESLNSRDRELFVVEEEAQLAGLVQLRVLRVRRNQVDKKCWRWRRP